MPEGSEGFEPVDTPPETMQRVERLARITQELRQDIIEEVKLVEKTVVDPLTDILVSFVNG